jgi:hypothetical protein
VDAAYFPGTVADVYWTNDPSQPVPSDAWYVYFVDGYSGANYTSITYRVRLVRSGQ